MIDIISREVSSTDLKDVVNKLIPDSIARDIEKACQGETSVNVVWSEKWWQFRHIEENTWSFWFARQADKYIKTLNLTYSGLDLKCNLELTISGIYPLHDVHIRKVKVMKRPRFDLNKLMDMHGEGSGELLKSLSLNQKYLWSGSEQDYAFFNRECSGKTVVTTDAATGEAVERPEGYEPPVLESV